MSKFVTRNEQRKSDSHIFCLDFKYISITFSLLGSFLFIPCLPHFLIISFPSPSFLISLLRKVTYLFSECEDAKKQVFDLFRLFFESIEFLFISVKLASYMFYVYTLCMYMYPSTIHNWFPIQDKC